MKKVFQFCVEHCDEIDNEIICKIICAKDTIEDLKLVPDVKVVTFTQRIKQNTNHISVIQHEYELYNLYCWWSLISNIGSNGNLHYLSAGGL